MRREDWFKLSPEERIARTLDTLENLLFGFLICFLVLLVVGIPVLLGVMSNFFSSDDDLPDQDALMGSVSTLSTTLADTGSAPSTYPTLTAPYQVGDIYYSFLPISFAFADSSNGYSVVQVGFSLYRGDDGYSYWNNSMVVLFSRLTGTTRSVSFVTYSLVSALDIKASKAFSPFEDYSGVTAYCYCGYTPPSSALSAFNSWVYSYGNVSSSVYTLSAYVLGGDLYVSLGEYISLRIDSMYTFSAIIPTYPITSTAGGLSPVDFSFRRNNAVYTAEQYNKYGSTMYEQGKSFGYSNGYDEGYDAGVASNTDLWGFLSTVGSVPLKMITDMLNFELFGVNVSTLVLSLLSVALVIIVLKLFVR